MMCLEQRLFFRLERVDFTSFFLLPPAVCLTSCRVSQENERRGPCLLTTIIILSIIIKRLMTLKEVLSGRIECIISS